MKFAAVIAYERDPARIAVARPAHRQYLSQLLERGHLVAAGPFADDSGALIIYEAGSAEEAEKLIQADPFCIHGIFARYDLHPWNAVLGNRALLPDGGS